MKLHDLVEAEASAGSDIELLKKLLTTLRDPTLRLKLHSTMQDEAMAEALAIMRRVVRGADGYEMGEVLDILADKLAGIRKALLPLPTITHRMEEVGLWLDNKQTGRTITSLLTIQQDVATTSIMLDNLVALSKVLRQLHSQLEIAQGREVGTSTLSPVNQAFITTTFKKLGLL